MTTSKTITLNNKIKRRFQNIRPKFYLRNQQNLNVLTLKFKILSQLTRNVFFYNYFLPVVIVGDLHIYACNGIEKQKIFEPI